MSHYERRITMAETSEKLPVHLSVEEVAARSLEQANTMIEYARVEEDKKAATSVFSKQLKDKRRRLDELAEAVSTGSELRIVGIREIQDPRRFVVETIRCDTMEIIRSRAMTIEEVSKAQNPTLFPEHTLSGSSSDDEPDDRGEDATEESAAAEDPGLVIGDNDENDDELPDGATIVDPAAVLGAETSEEPKRGRRGLRAIDGSKH